MLSAVPTETLDPPGASWQVVEGIQGTGLWASARAMQALSHLPNPVAFLLCSSVAVSEELWRCSESHYVPPLCILS